MNAPRAILFDLDDTLAESFRPPTEQMIDALIELLALRPLAILTAAGFPRIEKDFLPRIARAPRSDRFYVLPDGTSCGYAFRNGRWWELYRTTFSAGDRAKIVNAFERVVSETGVELSPLFKPLIIDHESKVAYAALGLDADEASKQAWDPERTKREKMRVALQKMLPEFDVEIGGKTTLDVFPRNITKAYGVQWLARRLSIAPQDMLYIADAFYPGGNDSVTIPTGVQTRAVTGPSDTLSIINELLRLCS